MYRPNVGICIINSEGKIFAGKRSEAKVNPDSSVNQSLWQMPQGGVENLDDDFQLLEGMYKELWEEVGLYPYNVKVLGSTQKMKYEFPQYVLDALRNTHYSNYSGQEQIWFYLQFIGQDSDIKLNNEKDPEFSKWKWVNRNFLLENVVEMKKNVYNIVLKNDSIPIYPLI